MERVAENEPFAFSAHGRQDQLSMFHASQAQKPVRKFPDLRAAAFEDDHLQTIMMIRVHVRCRQDLPLIVVLCADKLFGKLGLVVMVDQRDGSENDLVCGDLFFDEVIPHQVPDCLRAVAVTLLLDKPVKFREQVLFERNPRP